jgi:glutaredoxin
MPGGFNRLLRPLRAIHTRTSLPWTLALIAAGSLVLGSGAPAAEGSGSSTSNANAAIQPSTSRQKALARHLKRKGAVVYGAWWCPHCNHQKELFGVEAIELLPYVECDKDDAGRKQCQKAQVRGYPTWDLNGERRLGVLSLEELEIWSGYNSESSSSR